MTEAELKLWLRDLLHLRGAAGAQVNLRHDEAPFELAAKLWEKTLAADREVFLRVVLELIKEASETPWEAEPFHQLTLLVDAANLRETRRAFEAAAAFQLRLPGEHARQLQMLAVRTLLGLGWKGSPEFWQAHEASLGASWPELIFLGLAGQDLDRAFARIPDLIKTRESARKLIQLFPGLMRDFDLGMFDLRTRCCRVAHRLTPETAELLREWFKLQGWRLDPVATPINQTLMRALEIVIIDARPRVGHAGLSSRSHESAYADCDSVPA